MKTYISRATKWLRIFALISAVMLVTGIIFIVAPISNIGLQICLTIGGGLMSIVFLSCFIAEKSRALVICGDKFIFPRGTEKNGKTTFQKTVITANEISSVESKLYKGTKFITGDCSFYTLNLKNDTKVTVTLYAYGKKAEKEIIETIKKSIS